MKPQRRGRRGWSEKNTVLGGFRNAGANIQAMTRWRRGNNLLSPAGKPTSSSEQPPGSVGDDRVLVGAQWVHQRHATASGPGRGVRMPGITPTSRRPTNRSRSAAAAHRSISRHRQRADVGRRCHHQIWSAEYPAVMPARRLPTDQRPQTPPSRRWDCSTAPRTADLRRAESFIRRVFVHPTIPMSRTLRRQDHGRQVRRLHRVSGRFSFVSAVMDPTSCDWRPRLLERSPAAYRACGRKLRSISPSRGTWSRHDLRGQPSSARDRARPRERGTAR
jgi:hypothetical protein